MVSNKWTTRREAAVRVAVLGRAAADATLTTSLGVPRRSFRVLAVEHVPAGDITGAATNSLTLELRNRGPDDAINVLVATLAFVAGTNASRRQARRSRSSRPTGPRSCSTPIGWSG
jgi:hypothetical protein